MAIRFIDIASLLGLGVFIGIAGDGLINLYKAKAWAYVAILLALAFSYIIVVFVVDKLFGKIFPSGVKRIYKPKTQKDFNLLKLLSLMIGCLCGYALAYLGLGNAITNFFYFLALQLRIKIPNNGQLTAADKPERLSS